MVSPGAVQVGRPGHGPSTAGEVLPRLRRRGPRPTLADGLVCRRRHRRIRLPRTEAGDRRTFSFAPWAASRAGFNSDEFGPGLPCIFGRRRLRRFSRRSLQRTVRRKAARCLRVQQARAGASRQTLERRDWDTRVDRPFDQHLRSGSEPLEEPGFGFAGVPPDPGSPAIRPLRTSRHHSGLHLCGRRQHPDCGWPRPASAGVRGRCRTPFGGKDPRLQAGTTIATILSEVRRIIKRPVRVVLASSPSARGQAPDLRMTSVVWPELDQRPTTTLSAGIRAVLTDILDKLCRGNTPEFDSPALVGR